MLKTQRSKSGERGSKTEFVHACLRDGLKSPSEISQKAKAAGLDISANYVSNLKNKFGTRGPGRKRGRKPGRRGRPAKIRTGAASNGMQGVVQFVRTQGGIEAARRAIAELADLQV